MVSLVKFILGSQLVLFAFYGFVSWSAISLVTEYRIKQATDREAAVWIIRMTPEQLANTPI